MTMTQFVDAFTTLLRAALTQPVEKYWRLQPPTVLTVFVHASEESGETSITVGNVWEEGTTLDVYVETPWNDKEATAEAVDAVVETVKSTVHDNRDLEYATGLYAEWGKIAGTNFFMAERPGAGKPVYGARVRVTYTAAD